MRRQKGGGGKGEAAIERHFARCALRMRVAKQLPGQQHRAINRNTMRNEFRYKGIQYR